MQRLGLFIIIESAAQDVDSLLQAAVKEALTGHQLLVVSGHCGKGKGSESHSVLSDPVLVSLATRLLILVHY
jgi:hypothetical protein